MKAINLLAALALVAVFLSGCVGFRGPSGVRADLERSTGVDLHREVGVSVGPVGTWLARRIAHWSDEDEIPAMLDGIRRVEVGVYQVEGLRRGFSEPNPITLSQFDPSWYPLIEVHDGDEEVFILAKNRRDRIRQLLIVVAEEDEWVIVRMKGRIDHVLQEAVDFAMSEADYEGPPIDMEEVHPVGI